MAWGQKYEIRATWIFYRLMSLHTQREGIYQNIMKMKMDDKKVCNACSTSAMDYLQRRFKQLKKIQQMYEKVVAIHGNNTSSLRESEQVSVSDVCFDAFVKEVGYFQRHRQIQKKDNKVVSLTLLHVNTTKWMCLIM